MLKHWKLALVAASLLVGGVALAQPSGSKPAQDAPAHHQRDGKRGKRAAMLGRYDVNKDGTLDAGEKTAMQKDRFAKLDKNHDGVLSFDEAQPLMAKHHRGGGHGGRGFRGGRADKKQ